MLSELDDRWPWLRDLVLAPFPAWVSPMLVSVLALLAAFAAAGAFWMGMAPVAGLFVLVNGYLDIVDGYLARTQGRASERGDFIDHSFDRFADAALFTGVAFSPLVPRSLGLGTAVAVLLVSYLGTQAQALSGERLYAGLLGRADRIVVLAFAAVLAPLHALVLPSAVGLVLVLSVMTIVQRSWETWQRLG